MGGAIPAFFYFAFFAAMVSSHGTSEAARQKAGVPIMISVFLLVLICALPLVQLRLNEKEKLLGFWPKFAAFVMGLGFWPSLAYALWSALAAASGL